MFSQTGYDPNIYQAVLDEYGKGKKYRIDKWEWSFTKNTKAFKKIIQSISCPTLEDFNREMWDLFSAFANENTVNFCWGSPMGLEARNPYKPENRYYDGVVFYIVRKEFMDCINNQDVSHFMSCLEHYGYFCLDFVVIE